MATDPRDEIWNAAYRTRYDAAYNELLADRVVSRWQWFDETTKVLVALTASGSAVAGWALWNQEGLKYLWLLLAGTGAVLSIVNSALGVPARLKEWGDVKREFAGLAVDLQTFMDRMRFNASFPLEQFTAEFVTYRKRLGDAVQRLRNDLVVTRRFAEGCQRDLDSRMSANNANDSRL